MASVTMKFKQMLNERSVIAAAFAICMFMLCILWYTNIYPVAIFSVDDWTYISYKRIPVPLLGAWNPAKVFPEIYMPLMGNIGAFLIYPITGDYLQAITMSLGFGMSLIVVLYFESFRRFLIKKTGISDKKSILLALLFFFLHFAVFMSNDQLNKYLLGGDSLINSYNYTLPSLLNFSVVFILESKDNIEEFFKSKRVIRIGLLLIMIYFALFSNLYSNIILATYSSAKILLSFFSRKQNVGSFLRNNGLYFFMILLWAVCLLFEYQGGRANSLMQGSTVTELILGNASIGIESFLIRLKTLNLTCILVFVFAFAGAIIHIKKNRKSMKKTSVEAAFLQVSGIAIKCMVATVVYLYLLCLVAKPTYYQESFVWVAFIPWLFIITVFSLSYLQRKYRKARFLTPLVVCIILIVCVRHIGTLEESTAHNLPPKTCIALNRYVMDQIFAADENGQTEVRLILPVTNRGNKVTFSAPAHGERVVKTMYRHHLIRRRMEVNVEYSYEINELFQLDEELQPMEPKIN